MPRNARSTDTIDEADARRLLLLQSIESAPPSDLWTADDGRWASRAATQALGEAAVREDWLVERARLAVQRLAQRDDKVKVILDHPLWRPAWSGLALGLGLVIGLVSDLLLAGPYFNLLSLPLFGLLAWNLALFAGLAIRSDKAAAGFLRQGVARQFGRWLRRRAQGLALSDFALRWTVASAPLSAARVAWLLHLAGAALALGLVAGLYLRALVFDYRAGWATTLLDASVVHALLSTVFAPAQWISGIGLPDVTGIAAMRVTPDTHPAASAAPWLHLMALTLLVFVAMPRVLLAALAARRARGLSRAFPFTLSGPYFDRLRMPVAPSQAMVWVQPHGQAPTPQSLAGLRQWLAMALGEGPVAPVAPPVPYGDEDRVGATPAPAGRALVLLDLATTPEDEVHGRMLRALPGHPLLILDEAEFRRRFGTGERLAQRRAAWQALADGLSAPLVWVDLTAPEQASADRLRQELDA